MFVQRKDGCSTLMLSNSTATWWLRRDLFVLRDALAKLARLHKTPLCFGAKNWSTLSETVRHCNGCEEGGDQDDHGSYTALTAPTRTYHRTESNSAQTRLLFK